MRILITGGTGLIGQRLCAALLRAGHALTVLSRQTSRVAERCGAEVTAWDSLDRWTAETDFDAVINLAGEPIVDRRWTTAQKQRLLDSRVQLTHDLVRAIQRSARKPGVLLSGSAIGIYGDRGGLVLDEHAPTGRDFAARLCIAWEAAALPAEALGVRVCMLRTGLVLDTRGGLLKKMQLPARWGLSAVLGNGQQWMSWIHIDDYVNALIFLLTHERAKGAFNLTAPNPVTNRDFTHALAHAVNRPALFWAPAFLLRAMLGERASLVLGSQHVIPRRLETQGFHFSHPDLSAALHDLLARTPKHR